MQNTFCKYPLWECSETLINVAQGKQPAELVIKNANISLLLISTKSNQTKERK